MILVVGNEKGGCGKTTIANNLAALAAGDGLDTLLVDADPGQQSAAHWHHIRQEAHPEAPTIRCVSLTSRNIAGELADLGRRYDMVIVDTAPKDSPQFRAGATVADRMIIPVQPEPYDLWTLPTAETIFNRARDFNPKLEAAIVINRLLHQTVDSMMRDIAGFIAENVPTFASFPIIPLIGRAAYGRAAGDGLAVHEPLRRDARAAQEIRRLYKEVTRANVKEIAA
jgi:chromosome partitioning protein